jgi:hypothetical protein
MHLLRLRYNNHLALPCPALQVDERLDASVRRILQQNRRMAEELRIHVQVGKDYYCEDS